MPWWVTICWRKAMTWDVLYLSGVGRLMSFRYSTRLEASRGRYVRPCAPDEERHICRSFCSTCTEEVCALHPSTATFVLDSFSAWIRSSAWRMSVFFPAPCGPATTTACPDRNQLVK